MKQVAVFFLCFLSVALCRSQDDDNILKAKRQGAKAIALLSMSSRYSRHDVSASSNNYDQRINYRSSADYGSSNSFNSTGFRGTSIPYNFGNPTGSSLRTSLFDDAIILLKDCQKLDPQSVVYPFEIGYGYYLDNQFRKSIKYLERLQYHKDVTPVVFQLLSKSYAANRDSKNSMKTLERGMGVFPNAGNLYQERGMRFLAQKDSTEAGYWFLQGVIKDPLFAGCYYYAFLLQHAGGKYLQSAAIGEMFLRLEPSGPRYREVSRLLYHSFSFLFPFSSESENVTDTLAQSAYDGSTIGRFCQHLLSKGITEKLFPAPDSLAFGLLQFRKSAAASGNIEAYLYWLFQFGDQEGFYKWHTADPSKWTRFASWFKQENRVNFKF